MKTISILACALAAVWINVASARDYAVHVAVVDGESVRPEDVRRVRRILESRHKDALDVRTIAVPVPGPRDDADEAGRMLRERLDELAFRGGQRVRLLVVQAPGGVFADRVELEGLGKFGVDGPEARLRRTLEPLYGHFTRSARIVLTNFPSVVDPNGVARARGLLRDLGAPDGSFFGLTKPEPAAIDEARVIRRTKAIGLASVGAGLAAAAAAWVGGEPSAMAPLFVTYAAGSFVGAATLASLLDRVVPWIALRTGMRGTGRLVRLRDGDAVGVDALDLHKSKTVFACRDHLTGV